LVATTICVIALWIASRRVSVPSACDGSETAADAGQVLARAVAVPDLRLDLSSRPVTSRELSSVRV
jgi:hypothetical protein